MPNRLIQKAAITALLSHVLVFGIAFYLVDWLAVPSTINRVLSLSLDASPLDGNLKHHKTSHETLNDVEQGRSKSEVVDQLKPNVPIKELPAEEEAKRSPSRIEKTTKTAEVKSSPPPSQEQITNEQEPSGQPSTRQATVNTKKVDMVDVLLQQPSNITSLLKLEEQRPTAPASEAEQQMLQSKFTDVASKLDSFHEIPSHLEWQNNGQRYSANLFEVPADNEMGLPEIRVEVKTEIDGVEMSTEMSMKMLAFSNFAQFVHRWDPELQIHDDQMDGRFHSNSRINLEFDRHSGPVFHGKVTTASYDVNMNRYSRRTKKKNVFLGGLETGVKKIPMPPPSMLYFDDSPSSVENSMQFESDTRLVFNADGSYSAESLSEENSIIHFQVGEKPLYIHASSGTTLYVKGTVNGQVLVHSPKHIIIEGNLVYADRSGSPQSNDFLGLVSGRNVVIAAPSVTGRGDLNIDASIYAKGRFLVRAYRTKRSGTLVVFGSVSAGSMSATEPRYATKIRFDPRLEHRRPPKFPTTNRYELDQRAVIWSKLNTQ